MRTPLTLILCTVALMTGGLQAGTRQQAATSTDPEARLKELGIVLPKPSAPVANYVNAVRVGNLLFLAGKGPTGPDGKDVVGKLGRDLTVEQGYQAARYVAINQLAVLKAELGDLKRVKRIVKVLGMVNSDPAFGQQPEVVNGCSDLLVEVFGDKGRATHDRRSAWRRCRKTSPSKSN